MRDEKQIELKIGKSRLIAGAVFVGVVLLFLIALRLVTSNNVGMEKRAREAQALTPTAAPQNDEQRVFVAVALSEQAVDMIAQSSGIVEAVLVEVGTQVKAGTPLARLQSEEITRDASEAQAASRQADAEVVRAEAELVSAKQKYNARKIEGVVTQDERNAAEIGVKVATANLEVARQHAVQASARSEKAKYRASQLIFKAPFDGALAARYQNVGTAVPQGARIVRFVGSRTPLVRFAVPHDRAAALHIGDKATFRPDAAQQVKPDNVAVARIAPEADPHSGLVVVEAAFLEGGDDLRPGTVGKIETSATRL